MRKISIVFTVFCMICNSTQVIAKPTYNQARAIYNAMGKTIDESGIWYQKNTDERVKLAKAASALILQAEKAFGDDPLISPYRQCLIAVTSHQQLVLNLNELAEVTQGVRKLSNPSGIFMPLQSSVRFGDARAWCFSEIETLR